MRTWRDSAAEAGRAALPLAAAAASDGMDAEREEESTRCASTSRKATSTGRSCAAFAPPASMTALPFEAAISRTCESERGVALGSDGATQIRGGGKTRLGGVVSERAYQEALRICRCARRGGKQAIQQLAKLGALQLLQSRRRRGAHRRCGDLCMSVSGQRGPALPAGTSKRTF